MMHMRIIYAITASALIIISLIALVAYRSMQSPITSIRISKLCLNAPPNMHTDIYALNEGISCFRTDISLNQSESSSLKNLSYAGAEYLGILDYQTVGARISYNGCVSGCNWTLGDWNKSVLNAAIEYPEISEWEIYNEPLVGKFMSGYENGNATHYFMMIRSAYRIIKSKDPNATVVCFGGAQLYPIQYVQYEYQFYAKAWADGASKYCDAISVHAYSLPYYDLNQATPAGMTVAEEYNYSLGLYENLTGKPVWVTETGIPSNGQPGLSDAAQASFLRQDIILLSSHPYVTRIYWFNIQGSGNGLDYGLLNSTTSVPKPAWIQLLKLSGR